MEINLDEDTLLLFHETLVEIYKDTEDPITTGYSKGMIKTSTERPLTAVFKFIPFPHILHKASVLMETIINYHPFVDGNKRTALLATFYYLYWNGYNLTLPKNAADFTIDVAKGKYGLNDILSWLTQHSTRNWKGVLRNKLLTLCLWVRYFMGFEELMLQLISTMFIIPYPFMYFKYLIAIKKQERLKR